MYIITYAYTLEKQKDNHMQIEPPSEIAVFFRNSGESPQSLLSH